MNILLTIQQKMFHSSAYNNSKFAVYGESIAAFIICIINIGFISGIGALLYALSILLIQVFDQLWCILTPGKKWLELIFLATSVAAALTTAGGMISMIETTYKNMQIMHAKVKNMEEENNRLRKRVLELEKTSVTNEVHVCYL